METIPEWYGVGGVILFVILLSWFVGGVITANKEHNDKKGNKRKR